jgi:hypothetical protein
VLGHVSPVCCLSAAAAGPYSHPVLMTRQRLPSGRGITSLQQHSKTHKQLKAVMHQHRGCRAINVHAPAKEFQHAAQYRAARIATTSMAACPDSARWPQCGPHQLLPKSCGMSLIHSGCISCRAK